MVLGLALNRATFAALSSLATMLVGSIENFPFTISFVKTIEI